MGEEELKILYERDLDKVYLSVQVIEASVQIKGNVRKFYFMFGYNLKGKRKLLQVVEEKEEMKTSEWYNVFQTLKRGKMEKK